jgi:hypothetical protein
VSTFVNAAVSAVYFRQWIRITGHVRDAIRLGGYYDGLNPMDMEFEIAQDTIRDLMNTTFMGATNSGMEVSIDSTTAYAGITRGSAAYFEATETACGGALSRTKIVDHIEAVRDNDKGGRCHLFIGPVNQVSNYIRLSGEPNAQNTSLRVEMAVAGGNGVDYVPRFDGCTIAGAPFIGIGDFSNTVIASLDLSPDNWHLKIRRPFEIREQSRSGDDDVWQVSTASALVCKHPRTQGKITGATA